MRHGALIALLSVMITLCQPAHAELVVNGGFETGDFSGWTVDFHGEDAIAIIDNPDAVHTGRYAALVSGCCVEPPSILSQRLSTTPGTLYDLSFWPIIFARQPNYFSVRAGSAVLFEQENIPPQFPRDQMIFSFTATSASTLLEFRTRYTEAGVILDDISVKEHGAIPEPATSALIGIGILGLLRVGGRRFVRT